MDNKNMREIHLRVTVACYEQLETIAREAEVSVASVCRQALRQFLRNRSASSGPKSDDSRRNQ